MHTVGLFIAVVTAMAIDTDIITSTGMAVALIVADTTTADVNMGSTPTVGGTEDIMMMMTIDLPHDHRTVKWLELFGFSHFFV